MAKETRVLVSTSFYVYVKSDDNLTAEQFDASIIEQCEVIVDDLKRYSDDIEQISMDEVKLSKIGFIGKVKTIFQR